MVRFARSGWIFLLTLTLLAAPAARAEEEGESSRGAGSYTAAELEALDRALHAVNCTREDLRFDRDMAKGHECLPVVRRMLGDPLLIPPHMDGWARTSGLDGDQRTLRRLVFEAAGGIARGALGSLPPADSLLWPGEAEPSDPEAWVARLRPLLEGRDEKTPPYGQLGDPALRLAFPPAMAWHDVFASPFGEEATTELEARLEAKDAAWLHEQASRLPLDVLLRDWVEAMPEPSTLRALAARGFPTDRPLVVETSRGRIALGTPGNDVYEGEYAVLIDPAGNDRYLGCRIGAADGGRDRPVGLFIDLGGDDVYECSDVNFTLGAAILGIAAFYDLGAGDDHYEGGHASLGAAMGGIAVFYDDGGSDVYEGKTFTQGAAGFGLGLFFDDAVQERPETSTDEGTPDPVDLGLFDNDRLFAWANAQAFARCRGIALCVNRRGNDVYQAGGVYLHAPLFSDRYQSFSQGFAIGQRDIDYAGGIAMLIDHEGNDRYLGDIYNQGVGYWYSAGLLWDGAGNDTYEMTQYGQGSGIHLAVGGLVDVSGNDSYVMHSGLGQGGSHDYACSVLHDRGGNDRYLGSTSCNGSGLTNSVGIQIDRSGDDVYGARRKSGVNFGRPARGFASLGILLDLEGADDYLGVMEDGATWRHTDIGVGVDVPAPEDGEGAGAATPAADQPSGAVKIPEIVEFEGDLTDEVFQELWDIARRWEVGDNRVIVPKARRRLVEFGAGVLEKIDPKVATDVGGLDLRAYVAVLRGLREAGEGEAVAAFLRRNAESEVARRRRVALYLVGELEARELAPLVVRALEGEDEDLQLRAAGILAKLGSREGDATLATWLSSDAEESRIRAALPVLLAAGTPEAFRIAAPLLDHPLFSVRTTLSTLLAKHVEDYGGAISAELGRAPEALPRRALRTLLDALARAQAPPPDDLAFLRTIALLGDEDWGVRADAARVLRRWTAVDALDPEVRAIAADALETLLASESDPYVLFAAREP